MFSRQMITAGLAAALALSPVSRAAADTGDFVAGVAVGVIGSAIVRNAKKPRATTRSSTTTYVAPTYSAARDTYSYSREQNRETQTALNYFGFPAGSPDGILGRRSRDASAEYQAYMGYPRSGHLAEYERDFLVTSYQRALAGGATTNQRIAANPFGPRGLLLEYRDELAGSAASGASVRPASLAMLARPASAPKGTTLAVLPNLMGGSGAQTSLAAHCNKVSVTTNANGGYTTADYMTNADFALNEQLCLARTYAIAEGDDLAAGVQEYSAAQIEEQCAAFGPAMQTHISALSLKPADKVLKDVSGFVLGTGLSPAELSGTAKVCLSVGYRTDDMDVALGSALILTALGEHVYGELMGHHLAQGFGTSRRPDLALAWYEMGLDAIDSGAEEAFAPGQTERVEVLRKAAYSIDG